MTIGRTDHEAGSCEIQTTVDPLEVILDSVMEIRGLGPYKKHWQFHSFWNLGGFNDIDERPRITSYR